VANQFLNAQEYANVMLLLLKNQLVFGRLVDGQFKDQVTDENGLTINVKRPPRFVDSKDGTAALVPQDIVTGSAPVTVDQYSKVHIAVGDIEYIQSYNALMQNETMKSAASTLAHSLDKFISSKTLLFNSWVAGAVASAGGSANATDPTKGIASSAEAMGAHTRLMSQGCPNSDICGVATFLDAEMIRGSLLSSFTPTLNRTALEKVKIPLISEIDWYASQQLTTYTTGTRTQGNGSSTGGQDLTGSQNVNYKDVKGSAGVAGMVQNYVISGLSANQTVVAGDVFTISSVYSWDWRAQQANSYLQQFTVQANATANGSGVVTVSISPPIIVQGTSDGTATNPTAANTAFATVDSIPLTNAYIQFAGAASTKLTVRPAFNKRAISMVSARLQMPFTGVASYAVDPDTGIALRYWRGSDIVSGSHIHRWDCMYGATVLDPFLGTRVCGT
jgi:P22 coat protein - gene protein 5